MRATLDEARDAVEAGADALLLDNMPPDDGARPSWPRCGREHPDRPLLEISGGIDLDTIAGYATTGADMVSIGALTHSAPVLDIGLDVDDG